MEIRRTFPSITMSRLPGHALQTVPPPAEEVALIADARRRMHAAIPADAVLDMPYAISHARVEVPKLRRWEALAAVNMARAQDSRSPEPGRALDAARNWLAGPEPRRLVSEPGDVCFGQSDPNIRNFIKDGSTLQIVDFEDSGRSDQATELADLLEHVTLRGIPSSDWSEAIGAACSSPQSTERLLMARRMKAAYWLLRSLARDDPAVAGAVTERRVRAERFLTLMP
ncbi:hypothetical protein BJF79_09655 [Actinomadura sp. CNU-125]|nr:hypothetical protein BJF79_09655 [Actinomadura sp. CNU-125]